MTGTGVQEWSDGRSYDGAFVRGERHGCVVSLGVGLLACTLQRCVANSYGRGVDANGDVYEGDWVSNQRSGYGCLAYANGDRYVGEFRAHRPHGVGSFTTDGQHYEVRACVCVC